MKTFRSILALVVVAIMLGGCCSACRQRIKNARPLEGTVWHLVQIAGNDVSLPVGQFNITFAEGHISGVAQCNTIMGDYSLGDRSALSISHLASTRMACEEGPVNEARFAQMLEGTTHYDIDFDTLMLFENGVIKAIFKTVEAKNEQ